MTLNRHPVVLLAVILVMTNSEHAFAAPVGEPRPEIWVDGPLDVKPGNQPLTTDADVDHRGRQLFVWDSDSADATEHAIFLRIYDSGGNSLVGPVQVNTYDDRDQFNPRVAVSNDGSFLVIWDSVEPEPANEPTLYKFVRSRAYDSDGQPLGEDQRLNTVLTSGATDMDAAVAALPGGGYVAVWESFNSANMEENGYSIQGRLIDADGNPVGDQFQVDSTINDPAEADPSVTALADGGFFAVWSSRPFIWGRHFQADGTPVSDDFQIHTYDSGHNRDLTDVALNDDGRVLVVWRDREDNLNESEIRGRLYNPELAPMGPDFRINTLIDGDQVQPRVGNYGEAGFFVVWNSETSVGPDNEPNSIEGRVVNGPGSFATEQFLVNAFTATSQTNPAIGGRDGWVAIAWRSASNEEILRPVILGQLWNICGIFCDSFESVILNE